MKIEQLAQRRRDHALDMDRLLRQSFVDAVPAKLTGRLALVAVGGYGRTEMSPFSDIDVVLLHDTAVGLDTVGEIAQQLWYPIWDKGLDLDHSVRYVEQMRTMAADDYRAAFGLLDAVWAPKSSVCTCAVSAVALRTSTRWCGDGSTSRGRERSDGRPRAQGRN